MKCITPGADVSLYVDGIRLCYRKDGMYVCMYVCLPISQRHNNTMRNTMFVKPTPGYMYCLQERPTDCTSIWLLTWEANYSFYSKPHANLNWWGSEFDNSLYIDWSTKEIDKYIFSQKTTNVITTDLLLKTIGFLFLLFAKSHVQVSDVEVHL